MKPEEILQLPEHRFLGFDRGVPPILGELAPYCRAPEFRRGRSGGAGRLGLMADANTLVLLLVSGFLAPALALGWHEHPPKRLGLGAIARGIRTEILDRPRSGY